MKHRVLLLIFLIILITSPFSHLYAEKAGGENKPKTEENQPIQIISDRLEAYNEKRMVVFSGNAVATRGDMIIKSDRLLLYYRKGLADSEKVGAREIGKGRDLEKIEAKGNVTIVQGERIAKGDDAVFYQDTQKIVMTGSTVLQEGRNIMRGGKIVIFLDENRGTIESTENKRVTATIYPVEKKEKKE
ncbi:MAG: LptA/OstA family protein [Syntrophales bacterium]|nr:LptA/OstA family protein [Syntrophales bacterium]